ncbi:MAG TPA: ABC transporter permease [Bacteroidales bacterium]|nr:FtsX-like permease family protein [Bacteroidales bacterium]HQH41221.1 ABC transporter permease [Bacteroidales bacterium]
MQRYFHDIIIAFESLLNNRLRSMLTALGIIFGVAAVISMLAIGTGARQEILEQIKMVGVNNIVISPVIPEEPASGEESNSEKKASGEKKKFSPGLTLLDVEAIRQVIPGVKTVCPEITLNSYVIQNGKRIDTKIIGVARSYFDLFNLPLDKGVPFDEYQEEEGIPVCIIGANIDAKLFPNTSALNQYIKCGNVWLKVIGVLQRNMIQVSGLESAGVTVQNDNIFIPVKTMLMRFENRALITSRKLSNIMIRSGGVFIRASSSPSSGKKSNYHQLDRIIVQVNETNQLNPTVEVLSRMLLRRHMGVKDYEIMVPELLLKQQQRTRDIFNIVLGAIASISLLVGGIGIMNIMFANVLERIREIGIRMAIGATRKDIVVQFLSEAVLISVSGGILGVLLGIILSKLITHFSGILTVVSPFSVLLAFAVSASIGIIFGYSPAKRASEKDPIESLHYE